MMIYAILIAGGLILVIVGVAVIYVITYHTISITDLKTQGRVREIIDIFHDHKEDTQRRREALTALVEVATPACIEAMVASLSDTQDTLYKSLLAELPRLGEPLYPYLQKAFVKPVTRPGAARALAAVGPKAADVVLPFLNNPDAALRSASLQTLDLMGWVPGKNATGAVYWIAKRQPRKCIEIGPAATPALIEALKDVNLRADVIETMGEIRDASAGWSLLELGHNPQYSLAVAKALVRWRDAGVPLLLEALAKPDQKIRQMAINVLELIKWNPTADAAGARYWVIKNNWNKCIELGEKAVIPLLEVIDNRDIELDVIRCLGSIGDTRAIDRLIEKLRDSDVAIRQAAVDALGHMPHHLSIEALIGVLGDGELYPANVNALVAIGQPAVEELLVKLHQPDVLIRGRSAEVLERMGWKAGSKEEQVIFLIARQDWEHCTAFGEASRTALIEELNHPQNCVNAARALANMEEVQAIAPIVNACSNKPLAIQQALADALGAMGTAAVDALLDALKGGVIETLPVIRALGIIGDERAARPLTDFLSEIYPLSIREAAAEALGGIGLPALGPIFEALEGDGIDPRTAGIALGEAGVMARDRLITALKSKEYDAQILIYALGKIPDAESAMAIINTLQGEQYGQKIRDTAEAALLEIGAPAIKPLIAALARSPQDQAYFSAVLIKFGPAAVDQLVWALKGSFYPSQNEAIINVLSEIGDSRAVEPLLDVMRNHTINTKFVSAAIDNIWKKQRRDKERFGNGKG